MPLDVDVPTLSQNIKVYQTPTVLSYCKCYLFEIISTNNGMYKTLSYSINDECQVTMQ